MTGASSGIGEAFARALRARGYDLVLVARRGDRLAGLAGELGAEAVTTVALDLASPAAGAKLAEAVGERRIDLLVNNAGVGHSGRVHEQPLDRLLGIVDLNVKAVVEVTRRFLPAMVARGEGAVINVVSMSAFQPVPFLAVYAASKSFALSFTEALATELAGTGVAVQALCPGNIPTGFQQVAGTENVAYSKTPSMSPAEVVEESLRALDGGRLVVVPGLANRMTVALQGLAPRWLVRRVAGELFRPQSDSGERPKG